MRGAVAATATAVLLTAGATAATAATPSTKLALSSPAFHAGGTIPRAYTCDGRDVSPPLRWSAPPKGTQSFSLIVIDLDAHFFLHWRVTGIPARLRQLEAGQRVGHQAVNDFGRRGYGGPCPPPGASQHRYEFTLRALGASGRILGVANLLGRYRRS